MNIDDRPETLKDFLQLASAEYRALPGTEKTDAFLQQPILRAKLAKLIGFKAQVENDELAQFVRDFLESARTYSLQNCPAEVIDALSKLYWSKFWQDETAKILDQWFADAQLQDVWDKFRSEIGTHHTAPTRMARMIETCRALQHLSPGSIRTLYEEFGIRHFNRYNPNRSDAHFFDILRRQFEERDTHKPYVVVIFPADPAMSGDEAIEEVASKLQELGYALRFIEASGLAETVRRLRTLHEKYGQGAQPHKPDLLIANGHGHIDQISTQQYPQRRNINTRQLRKHQQAVALLQEFLNHNSTILFLSCLIGGNPQRFLTEKEQQQLGGNVENLAQGLSRLVPGITVLAPPGVLQGGTSLDVHVQDGALAVEARGNFTNEDTADSPMRDWKGPFAAFCDGNVIEPENSTSH